MNDPASETVFRILLAEDAPDQSLLLSALLQKLGPFEVTLVQDGLQALDLARTEGFDLILTDLNLPGIDGFELTRRLKSLLPGLPVLAATGYADPEYVEGAYRAGVDALMTKPVDPEDLEARLRELLPRWRAGGSRPPSVIAVGARPGDVELGCGASLAAHHAAGHEVVLFVLSTGGDDATVARARKAAEALGARIVVADTVPGGAGIRERQDHLQKLVDEMGPTWAYVPAAAERDRARREVHRIAAAATRRVTTVLGYATTTTTLAFRPTVFRDVGRWMDEKLTALACHRATAASDPGTSPDFARAHARYWGRFKDFAEVEPFDLVRDSESASVESHGRDEHAEGEGTVHEDTTFPSTAAPPPPESAPAVPEEAPASGHAPAPEVLHTPPSAPTGGRRIPAPPVVPTRTPGWQAPPPPPPPPPPEPAPDDSFDPSPGDEW